MQLVSHINHIALNFFLMHVQLCIHCFVMMMRSSNMFFIILFVKIQIVINVKNP